MRLDPAFPLVSVVIPFRNDASTITEAVASVCGQSWPNLELILCEDGSTDTSLSLALEAAATRADMRVKTLQSAGKGAAAARNLGLGRASGEFVAFLDADDLWFGNKLEVSISTMRARALDVFGHSEEWRSSDGGVRTVRYDALVDRRIPFALSVFRQNPFSTSATIVRLSLVTRAGTFDESLPSAEDFDYWLRLCLTPDVRAEVVGDVLGVYTLRPGSESSRVDARHEAMLAIGDRFIASMRGISSSTWNELWRYRSRVRLASGVRYISTGRVVWGAVLACVGLLQWPFRPEIARWVRARLRGPETPQRAK